MSDPNRGGQHPEFDLALRDNEVAIFCHDVLWPAINYLAGREFIGEALPGSEIDFEVTNPTESKGLSKIRVTAYVDAPYNGDGSESSDDSVRVCSVSIGESITRPDLLTELFKVACNDGKVKPSVVKKEGARAWSTTTFSFEDEDFKTTRLEVHQLTKLDGAILWDDYDDDETDEGDDEANRVVVVDGLELSEAEQNLLDEIEDDIYSSVRREDIPEIRRMLGILGVPSDILAT